MEGQSSKKSFWATLPGILTGLAAVIGSVGTIYLAMQVGHGPQTQEMETGKILMVGHDSSAEDAEVYVNGKFQGRLLQTSDGVRLLIRDIPSGVHKVRVVKPGHEVFNSSVTVTGQQIAEVNFELGRPQPTATKVPRRRPRVPVESSSTTTSQQPLPSSEESSILEEVARNNARLSRWPSEMLDGEEILNALAPTLKKVEKDREYQRSHRDTTATLFRTIGGAYLIHSGMELRLRLTYAIRYLKRSMEIEPEQPLLRQNTPILEKFVEKGEGDAIAFFNAIFQIVRGDDRDIPRLVDFYVCTESGNDSQECDARRWLLYDATAYPIWNYLEVLQQKLKTEKNIEAIIKIKTETLPNGTVQVEATLGPNIFLWGVDYKEKRYNSKNELTEGLMRIVQSVEQQ